MKENIMSNNLRDQIEQIIEAKTYATAPDGFIDGTGEAAQAIIEEFGLTVESGHITGQGYGLPGVIGKRVVGKWGKK